MDNRVAQLIGFGLGLGLFISAVVIAAAVMFPNCF